MSFNPSKADRYSLMSSHEVYTKVATGEAA